MGGGWGAGGRGGRVAGGRGLGGTLMDNGVRILNLRHKKDFPCQTICYDIKKVCYFGAMIFRHLFHTSFFSNNYTDN